MKSLLTIMGLAVIIMMAGCLKEEELREWGDQLAADRGDEECSSVKGETLSFRLKKPACDDLADETDQEIPLEPSPVDEVADTNDTDEASNIDDTEEDTPTDPPIVGTVEPIDPVVNRTFLGTWELSNASRYVLYGNWSIAKACAYSFPAIVRMWSHDDDDLVDSENNRGELIWTAEIFEDETSDFKVDLVDSYGKPKAKIYCTCEFVDAYYDHTVESYYCGCEPTNGDPQCSLVYLERGN